MKTCNKCDVELVRGENIAPSQFDKSNFKCRPCKSEEQRAYRETESGKACHAKYASSDKGKASAKRYSNSPKRKVVSKRYGQTENGKAVILRNVKKHYQAKLKGNAEHIAKKKAYRQTDSAKTSQKKSRARQIASGEHAFHQRNRVAAQLQRTPIWSDLDHIKQIYLDCPEGKTVDHVVPLQGEIVSGLHVPENLQYLTPSENSSKINRWVA